MAKEMTCPHCGAVFCIGINLDSTKNRCPRCSKTIVIGEKTGPAPKKGVRTGARQPR